MWVASFLVSCYCHQAARIGKHSMRSIIDPNMHIPLEREIVQGTESHGTLSSITASDSRGNGSLRVYAIYNYESIDYHKSSSGRTKSGGGGGGGLDILIDTISPMRTIFIVSAGLIYWLVIFR